MAIPISQQRKLLQRSGNVCAFPDCRLLLTAEGTADDPVVVLGEIAHIVAESPDGPRGDSPLTRDERNLYQNLILLCNQHHQLIDSEGALATYTVERLTAMKQDHEQWVERSLRGRSNVVAAQLPPMVNDTIFSNLLPVHQMPRHIWGAPCSVAKEGDIRPSGLPESIVAPFVVRGGWLWAFQNLRSPDSPFADAVDHTAAERHICQEWWTEADRLGWYIALLNRCLNKLTGRLGLRFDRAHRRYYFEPEAAGTTMEVSYKPLNAAKATRKVVWQPTKKATGEPRSYWFHRAVGLRFIQASPGQWLLSIRPELRVTSDGVTSIDAEYIGRKVTRKKSRLFNYDLLGEVQFWRDFLSSSSPRIILPFTGDSAQRLIISTGINSSTVRWPGIPDEHAKPFKNVEYVDDLFTWAEGEGLFDDDPSLPGDPDDEVWDIDAGEDEDEVTA